MKPAGLKGIHGALFSYEKKKRQFSEDSTQRSKIKLFHPERTSEALFFVNDFVHYFPFYSVIIKAQISEIQMVNFFNNSLVSSTLFSVRKSI